MIIAYKQRILKLEAENRELKKALDNDSFTGLLNKEALKRVLDHEIKMVHRNRGLLAFMMLDIDNFSEINNTLGHDVGDKVILEITEIIKSCVRESDYASRFGGDEFSVILPSCCHKVAVIPIARKIKQKVIELSKSYSVNFSASIGVAQYYDDMTPEGFIKRADSLLYHAKNNGKNKIGYINDKQEFDLEE